MGMLFEKCHGCDAGEAEPPQRLRDGTCPGCRGERFVPTGLVSGQLDNLVKELKGFIRRSVGRNSAFESGHYYLTVGVTRLQGDDPELIVEQAISLMAGGFDDRGRPLGARKEGGR